MPDSFEQLVARYGPRVDEALRCAVPRSDDLPPRLAEAMNYSLLAGGKRLRPILCLLACEAVGGDAANAVPAATALELIHTYSLIHDDLPAMDDDDLRRGRPTCHKQFDEATAILAGDGLLTLAFEVLADGATRVGMPACDIARSVGLLANAAGAEGMVGGQVADLEGEVSDDVTLDGLVAIHRRKTGRLISGALTLGGIAGAASDPQIAQLTKFGEDIGLAFQIADDLLDETGDAGTIGKEVRKDAGRGKATYPGFLGLDESRRRAEALIADAKAALSSFGDAAEPLKTVADYVVSRDR